MSSPFGYLYQCNVGNLGASQPNPTSRSALTILAATAQRSCRTGIRGETSYPLVVSNRLLSLRAAPLPATCRLLCATNDQSVAISSLEVRTSARLVATSSLEV